MLNAINLSKEQIKETMNDPDIKMYLKFWLPVEATINGKPLILCRGDRLIINKYISSLTQTRTLPWKSRLMLSLHGIAVKEIKKEIINE